MRDLIFAVTILFVVPTLRAQQTETKENQPQTLPQEATENSNAKDTLPEAIRPGHPLDPADVDVLTGKKDREMEADRTAVFYYGAYADSYAMDGRRGAAFNLPFFPLTRISNPVLFSVLPTRGIGRGGFRGRR